MTSRMPLITSIDQHEIGITTDNDKDTTYIRRAARAVLTSEQGHVAVMYFTKAKFYKLPGGGIDDGEAIREALRREIREETGYEITDIEDLGAVEENRYYDGMHQTSYCFTAVATEFIGTQLTEKEAAKGMELHWARDIDEAIQWIEGAQAEADEDESAIGLTMMKLRDAAILRAAQSTESVDNTSQDHAQN